MSRAIEEDVSNLIMNSLTPPPGTSVIINSSNKVIDSSNGPATTQEDSEIESPSSPSSNHAVNEEVEEEPLAAAGSPAELEENNSRDVPNDLAVSNSSDNNLNSSNSNDNENRISSSSDSNNVVIEEEQIAIDTDTDDDVILVDPPVETIDIRDDEEEEEDVQIINSNQPIPKPLPAKSRRLPGAKSISTPSCGIPPTPRLPEPSTSSYFSTEETENVPEITLLYDLLDNHFGNIDFDIPTLDTTPLAATSSALGSLTNSTQGTSSNDGLFITKLSTEIAIQTEEYKPPVNDMETQTTESSFARKRKWEYNDDDGDGTQCPICYEPWEESGDHCLVSLKCGHLFGDSCIKRWFNDQAQITNRRFCPVCRTKAEAKHIRPLYARRIVQIKYDRLNEVQSELDRYKERAQKYEVLYNRERTKNADLLRNSGLHCGPSTSSADTPRIVPVHQFGGQSIVTRSPAQIQAIALGTRQIQATTSRPPTLIPPLAHSVNPPSFFATQSSGRDMIPRFIHFSGPEFAIHDYSQVPDQRNINH